MKKLTLDEAKFLAESTEDIVPANLVLWQRSVRLYEGRNHVATVKYYENLGGAWTIKNKEEVKLDEAIPKSTGHAVVHSSSGKIIAKGNKAEMQKKMKELNAKEKGSHRLERTSSGKVGDTFGLGPSPADKLSIRNEEVEFDEDISDIPDMLGLDNSPGTKRWLKFLKRTDPEFYRKFENWD